MFTTHHISCHTLHFGLLKEKKKTTFPDSFHASPTYSLNLYAVIALPLVYKQTSIFHSDIE